jgi:hypothetical protein
MSCEGQIKGHPFLSPRCRAIARNILVITLGLVGQLGVILLAFLRDRIAHWPLPLPLTLDCAAEAAGKELKL